MENNEALKAMVKEKYTLIANQSKTENETSCCGVGGCATVDYAVFAENYQDVQGYNADADLGLGCGLPTEFAQINPGDTVLDLGSGAGNDCFVARAITGESGKVIGVDMTETMIEKSRVNAEKLGFNNVEFRLGDIERLPITANTIDVIISNCVLNLVPDKAKAFAEMYRVLKPSAHFSISDVVLQGTLPEGLRNDAEMYAGCVSGAISQTDYLKLLSQAGFVNVQVQKSRKISLPTEILSRYLDKEGLDSYAQNDSLGIYSITVYGQKPATQTCAPDSGCC
jgi:ubiquinone/menaquinone biosynthesis C-methylase UbiE